MKLSREKPLKALSEKERTGIPQKQSVRQIRSGSAVRFAAIF